MEGPSAEQALADIDARIKSLRNQIGTPGQGRSDTADLQMLVQKRRDELEPKAKRERGEVKTVSVEVPEEKASQIHSELHKMWKGQDGRRIPWGTFATDKENVTSFQFTDYPTGDEAVEKLIAHVKASQ